MKILLDSNTPRQLKASLRRHDVVSSDEQGWRELPDGELLATAERTGFDVLITCDQNMPYQQNLKRRKIALVVLTASKWRRLQLVAHDIATAVDFVQRGQVVVLDVAAMTAAQARR